MSDNVNLSQEERNLAVFCHLGPLAGVLLPVFGSILIPLIIWLVKRDESDFIKHHGREALNFQLTMILAFIAAFVLVFVIIGIPLLIGLVLFELIILIVAAVKTAEGRFYRYPFCIQFIG